MKKYSETKGGKNLIKAIEYMESLNALGEMIVHELSQRFYIHRDECPDGDGFHEPGCECGARAQENFIESAIEVISGVMNFDEDDFIELRKFIKLVDDGVLNMDGTQK